MSDRTIILRAKDCKAFEKQEGHSDAIQYFISIQKSSNVFRFNNSKEKQIDDSPIISFNHNTSKWCAGRYIGEAYFNYKNTEYKIEITPRFGDVQLFHMLEEVFNIKFSDSNQKVAYQKNTQLILKRIIAFLWLNMLSKANKHGLPRTNKKYTYKGAKIRGKLNIGASTLPLHIENNVVSNYWEKTVNEPILKVLKGAYKILKEEYGLAHVNASSSAKNILDQLVSSKVGKNILSENEYNKIVYKSIYKSFKPVVDLSWDILKKKKFGNKKDENSLGTSFFLDMAEIWELYLVKILTAKLAPYGWVFKSDIIQTYPNKNFKRKLIPDIVFKKGEDVLVWDAKYKRMKYDYFDYDRSDFFQIHTYINHYDKKFNVISAGLIYPLSKEYTSDIAIKNTSNSIFGLEEDNTCYCIDGIELIATDKKSIKEQEEFFLNRFLLRIQKK